QYLLLTRRTLFRGMSFEQVRRMQVDIETRTEPGFEFCNPERKADRIIVIAMGDESGWEETLYDRSGNEERLIEQFVERVRERDPDVIEGHNIFKFDLPYIATRAGMHGVKLTLGRDGRLLRSHPSRFSVGERVVSFPKFEIAGRHIIDTFFLVQAYDVSHRSLEGFGLKQAAAHFNISAPDRTKIEGSEISSTFERDPERVLRYALDDIRETRALSSLLSRSAFVQAQMLPFSYQTVCVRGSAAKIDALMVREYLRRGQAIPSPDRPREFEGGYTDIFMQGVIRNVHHCDCRALYPSIMLAHKLAPAKDRLGVFLQLLDYLRTLRLDAKQKMAAARKPSDQVHFDSLQTTFKILINSFYGYLGFGQARFSDFSVAEQVTAEGRSIVKNMVKWLQKHGAKPVEVDTDGIYFVPPDLRGTRKLNAFRNAFQRSLPKGVEIEFDGEYVSMFSYKMKNYALLDASGEIIIKGAALKSRGLEPYLRSFLRDLIRLKLESRDDKIPALKKRYEKAVADGTMTIRQLAKTETLKDALETYSAKIAKRSRGRNAAYELALRSGRPYQAGDQISYYITGTKKSVSAHESARRVSDWDPEVRDENTAYYAAKLNALYDRLDSGGDGDADPTGRKGE
ncbi:DNA polymerase domain-containing protein, partial [Verrucomicrobiota bacterium]